MKLVPVESLSDVKQLTYGDLKPDDWFSKMNEIEPTAYKTNRSVIFTNGKQHDSHTVFKFQPDTPVRVYKVELHYERVE